MTAINAVECDACGSRENAGSKALADWHSVSMDGGTVAHICPLHGRGITVNHNEADRLGTMLLEHLARAK